MPRMKLNGSRGWSIAVGLFKYYFFIICQHYLVIYVGLTRRCLGNISVICLLFIGYRFQNAQKRKISLHFFGVTAELCPSIAH